MWRLLFFLLLAACLAGLGSNRAFAQTHSSSEPLPPSSGGGTDSRAGNASGEETVDGIAARIEDDIITESEVRELSAFQELVEGKPKPRSEIIKELANQWIVRGETAAGGISVSVAGGRGSRSPGVREAICIPAGISGALRRSRADGRRGAAHSRAATVSLAIH